MNKRKVKGKIIIISSPSGGGKTSICKRLLNRNKDWQFSISVTTRKKRRGEKNGREYFFVEHADFLKQRERGKFAEWCKVHSFLYGTPKGPMESVLYKGGVMLLDVDVKGAKKLKKIYKEAATIFILPPGRNELKQRLKKRGTEDDKHFKIRQSRALSEMKLFGQFEYLMQFWSSILSLW